MAISSDLPEKAADTTAENPWPVRLLSHKMGEYISRMSPTWIEGQIVQYNPRPGAGMQFMVMRDVQEEVSLSIKIFTRALPPTIKEGDRVVAHAKPDFYLKTGSLSMLAREIRPVGVGTLLAQIEALRVKLTAEGLFSPERKVTLPLIPRVIGLVCGREAKAKADVVNNVRLRWPAQRFEIREVAVQGIYAVEQVSNAMAELDAIDEVDVIVVARGGGSVEDLLPFSDEALIRAAAAVRTPLVSAIGHEGDSPLLDLVADLRASTPTDAAKRIVPDAAEEARNLTQVKTHLRRIIDSRLTQEMQTITLARTRPALADPTNLIDQYARDLQQARDTARFQLQSTLSEHTGHIATLRSALRALSPLDTLARGYSIIRRADGSVLTDASTTAPGERLEAILAHGRLGVEVTATTETTD